MSDTRNDGSLLFTKTDIIIPMVTGSISFLSSMIIISIVLRSMSGIKTTYHRIILGLSFADCLSSFTIALTTIPMPKDVIYPFDMPSYGNIATCEAQGFVHMVGIILGFCMTGILNIYYVCTLRYNMPERSFRCYLEIPLYIVALVISIAPTATLIPEDLLNPSSRVPWSAPTTYPLDCTKADNLECRGVGERNNFYPLFLAVIGFAFFTLTTTMALVVHSSYRNERKLRKAVEDDQLGEGDDKYTDFQYAREASLSITRQAMMYIAAFLMTWIFGIIQMTLTRSHGALFVLRMIFQPLQGLFNLFIFTHHKVHMILLSDEDVKVGEALGIVLLHPARMEDSVLVSNLGLVLEDYYSKGRYTFRNGAVESNSIDKSEVISGFEDGVGHRIQLDSEEVRISDEASNFVDSEGLVSNGEEGNKIYKHYGLRRNLTSTAFKTSTEGSEAALVNDDDHSYSAAARSVRSNLSGFSNLSKFSSATNDF